MDFLFWFLDRPWVVGLGIITFVIGYYGAQMSCVKHRLEGQKGTYQITLHQYPTVKAAGVSTVYVFGTLDGEHLRIERRADTITFISRELSTTYVNITWRDRVLVSMNVELWEQLKKVI